MSRWVSVAVIFALVSFFLTPVLWHPSHEIPMPSMWQLPFFIVLALIDSIVFGIGIAFSIFGYTITKKVAKEKKMLATLLYLSITWMLISWWPHANLHMANGMDLQGLLYIEYGFHVTLMIAGLITTYAFLTFLTVSEKIKSK